MTLASDIEAQLTHHGSAGGPCEEAEVKAWRSTARSVARTLGRPVKTHTYVLGGRHWVGAVLTDFPRNKREKRQQLEAMERTMALLAVSPVQDVTVGL